MTHKKTKVEFRKTILSGGKLDSSVFWLDTRLTKSLQSAVIGGVEYVKKGFGVQKFSDSEHELVFIMETNEKS